MLGIMNHFGAYLRDRSLRVLGALMSLNDPQWGNPNVNVSPTNVSAAKIRSTGGPTSWQQAGARAMRLGLRVEW